MAEPIPIRLCDDAGMVSDEPVAGGFPGSQYGLTYRELLNNGRAANGDPDHRRPYTGEPFPCTGSFHVAGVVWRCTSPAHRPKPIDPGTVRLLTVPFAGEGGSGRG